MKWKWYNSIDFWVAVLLIQCSAWGYSASPRTVSNSKSLSFIMSYQSIKSYCQLSSCPDIRPNYPRRASQFQRPIACALPCPDSPWIPLVAILRRRAHDIPLRSQSRSRSVRVSGVHAWAPSKCRLDYRVSQPLTHPWALRPNHGLEQISQHLLGAETGWSEMAETKSQRSDCGNFQTLFFKQLDVTARRLKPEIKQTRDQLSCIWPGRPSRRWRSTTIL
jgi:hypothetical protein